MTIDINIVNGKLFTSEGFKEGGLSIEGERIIRVGKEPNLERASQRIDVKGAMILPGLIDIHVHMRDLEQKYKETMETGTRSAIAGGITSVLDMPNNKPPTNQAMRVEFKKKIIFGKAAANIGFYSLIPNNIEEIINLTKEGIFGFKIYPSESIYPPKNNELLKTRMAKIAEMKLPLIIHPDSGFADETEKLFLEKHQDPINSFLAAHNQFDEAQALTDFLQINEKIKCHLHCAHITAKETMEIMLENKELKTLSGEVCPHYLYFTQKDLVKFKSEVKCLPPLRTKEDQKILWKALNDDQMKIIATDHAPHSYNEKFCEFEAAAAGIHGLETLLPVMFTAAFKGMINLEKLIPKMTKNPAEHSQIEQRGELKEGNFADIIIVVKEKGVIDVEKFESKAKWSPFNGFVSEVTLKQVFINGHMVKDDEYVESKARTGKILERPIKVNKEKLEPRE
ncbi:MAG: dihydroorotase family protein [Candidatus Heimdallarchaeota archaeon]|nr:dihydroorotase family protein [Candidatus Heimdallarchaeota archaeon]